MSNGKSVISPKKKEAEASEDVSMPLCECRRGIEVTFECKYSQCPDKAQRLYCGKCAKKSEGKHSTHPNVFISPQTRREIAEQQLSSSKCSEGIKDSHADEEDKDDFVIGGSTEELESFMTELLAAKEQLKLHEKGLPY